MLYAKDIIKKIKDNEVYFFANQLHYQHREIKGSQNISKLVMNEKSFSLYREHFPENYSFNSIPIVIRKDIDFDFRFES